MGALTSNRKRGNDFFSSNSKTPLSNLSKKLKLSVLNPPLASKSTVERFFKYPDPINPIGREVHAPCRKLRFGSKQTKSNILNYKGVLEYSGSEMGNCLSRKHEETKRSDFYGLRKDIEVIDIDGDDAKEGGSEDSSIEEVVAWGCKKSDLDIAAAANDLEDSSIEELERRGCEKSDLLGQEVDDDVKILDGYDGKDSSVLTTGLDDENLKEESVVKMIDSLAMNPKSDSYFYVPLYRKLLGSVGKISDKLKRLQFQIELNEKSLETNRLLRPQKKEEQVKEDAISEPFVPLTEEEHDEVTCALSKSNRRKVLVTHKSSNIDITGEILQCLRPGAWLNDEVINVYLELLREREKREPQKFLKCHFFNTFFYKKLTSGTGGYNYQSVRRWTSQRKLGYSLLECDKIFVPIHKEIHWCLAVINKKDQKFQYLDSLRGKDRNVLKVLATYFVDEVKDKSGKYIDVSSWMEEFVEDLPEQKNGYDCGVFMIKNADFYSRDIGLCFNQGDMPYFRMRTAKELLRLKAD
ncbi:ubiquitin-like-specific protease ESD4 [Solanum pennellii]|uniref:Ubiquitin-like-specific protease ESD4 n=1 Tax=Solanum pennellii TaxID=28526 RepID=A0ABM1FND5_SOLPN|nr:ubiquitin-like-specific protease ESD4 [Solanum pennellii]